MNVAKVWKPKLISFEPQWTYFFSITANLPILPTKNGSSRVPGCRRAERDHGSRRGQGRAGREAGLEVVSEGEKRDESSGRRVDARDTADLLLVVLQDGE